MKTLTKSIALLLTAILSISVFAACPAEKTPTVEEIFDILSKTENGKIVSESSATTEIVGMTSTVKVLATQEKAGNLSHITMTIEASAAGTSTTNTTELYIREEEGGKITGFTKDTAGKWTKAENISLSDLGLSDQQELKPVFVSDLYGEFDKEAGTYTMKDGTKVSATFSGQDAEFTNAVVGYKDGVYTFSADYTIDGVQTKMSCKLSDIGNVTVTLPEGVEG